MLAGTPASRGAGGGGRAASWVCTQVRVGVGGRRREAWEMTARAVGPNCTACFLPHTPPPRECELLQATLQGRARECLPSVSHEGPPSLPFAAVAFEEETGVILSHLPAHSPETFLSLHIWYVHPRNRGSGRSDQTTNQSLEPRPTGGSSQTDTQPSGDQSPKVQWQVSHVPREIQLLQGPGERPLSLFKAGRMSPLHR